MKNALNTVLFLFLRKKENRLNSKADLQAISKLRNWLLLIPRDKNIYDKTHENEKFILRTFRKIMTWNFKIIHFWRGRDYFKF